MWRFSATPRPTVAWVPAGAWFAMTFLAVLFAVIAEGRVAEPVRLAPAVAMAVALPLVAVAIGRLRAPTTVVLRADPDGLEVALDGGLLSVERAREDWRMPADRPFEPSPQPIPWTHPSFAKLRAPRAQHFLDGQLRVGLGLRIDAWVPPAEGLIFLTRCRILCLRRLGGGESVEREIRRLQATVGEQPG